MQKLSDLSAAVTQAKTDRFQKQAVYTQLESLRQSGDALDSFPANDLAVTEDALAVGVPVVTLRGRHFASCCSASLLAAAGASDLVAEDLEGYRRIALGLARDPSLLTTTRARLLQARSRAPLFDLTRFLGHLEQAYGRMWRQFMAGRAPEAIEVQS